MPDSLQPHGLQHTRLPCPSPTPGAYSNSCPSSRWYHPTISFSVIPFSSCLQSFPASGSFPVRQFFASGSQSIGASASGSVLRMNFQGWFPLASTGFISLLSEGLSRVFSCCCCCWVAPIVSDSVRPHRWQPTRLPCAWNSPGKNNGVGCHFLLQCRKVKSESEVAQSCPTLYTAY